MRNLLDYHRTDIAYFFIRFPFCDFDDIFIRNSIVICVQVHIRFATSCAIDIYIWYLIIISKPQINVDTDNDNIPNINIDTNGDMKADINIDISHHNLDHR